MHEALTTFILEKLLIIRSMMFLVVRLITIDRIEASTAGGVATSY